MEKGSHTGAGLLAGPETLWGTTLEQPVPEGMHPMEGIHTGVVRVEL